MSRKVSQKVTRIWTPSVAQKVTRSWRRVIDEGAYHQLFEGRVWESVRLARLSQGHHKGIRVTSATTLIHSHGRGARGAVAALDIGRGDRSQTSMVMAKQNVSLCFSRSSSISSLTAPTPPILASAVQRLRVLPHPL